MAFFNPLFKYLNLKLSSVKLGSLSQKCSKIILSFVAHEKLAKFPATTLKKMLSKKFN